MVGTRSHTQIHVVVWLVPEVIPKFTLVLLILNPEAFGLEGLAIEEDEDALAIREAVGGVRGPHSKSVHLPRLDDLVQLGVEGIRLHVHNVYSVRSQGRNNQPAP